MASDQATALRIGNTAIEATAARAPLTGWLQKVKTEGGKSRFLGSANRRFFTLDFDGQLFYYSSTEGNKNLSMPIAFKDILGVEFLPATDKQPDLPQGLPRGPSAPSHSLNSLPFSSQGLLRSLPSLHGYAKRAPESHGFIVKLKGKSMQLLCNSQAELHLWIGGFWEAIAMSRSARQGAACTPTIALGEVSDLSTTTGSSQMDTPRSSSQDASGSGQTTTPRSNNEDGSPLPAPYLASGGTRHEFPPMAPGTPPLDLQLPTSPLGSFGGDVACRSIENEKGTPPLRPGASLRATAATR